ncbi:SCL-interrupting locus protein homolog [Gadus chalcogrammus]|uniref:SCL-interrupting locus protein homolog n=1 Tax=Gadus chalcogrammus TaxID=1042646 RepID=UPI0024C481F6|nr:SCL-interrupting locus protein homolog [Gadus chalcogrammus]
MNLHGLPALVYGDVLTGDTLSMTRRTTGNAPSTLAFPKSKSSLWDPSPSGDAVGLQLCYYRCPHLRVLEKALRLAHRHAHQRSNPAHQRSKPAHQRSNPAHQRSNPALCCFLLGSICVDEDEEGVTLSLDRFDPGREQGGVRVPSLLLPGDVAVPLEFTLQGDPEPSPLDLSLAFQGLQQACRGAEVADLSQLLGVRGQVSCSQQGDRLDFSLRWLAASCAGGFDVVGVRPLAIIPTALARSLSGLPGPSSPVPPRPGPSRTGLSRPGLKQQRGFLTMDQTRKLLLLLESDPKACSLPLVGVWLSGVVQPSNPLVWAWCLRFSHSSSLQDRVLSEQGWFLLVLFSPSQPRFFQVRSAESGPTAVLRLSCSQHLTLFKHLEPAEGHYLQADLCLDETRQTELVHGPAARPLSSLLGATLDQDSGVEDEDLSPRPSPSPHAATQQTRRVQPSVPELSLLVDASLPPTPQPPSRRSSGPLGPPYLHSTPAAPLSRASAGFWTAKTPPTLILLHPERGSTPPGPPPPPCPAPVSRRDGRRGRRCPPTGQSVLEVQPTAQRPDPRGPDFLSSKRLLQVSSRLQASLSDPESPIPSSPSSSSSSLPYGDHAHSYRKQEVHARSYRKQEVHARSYRKQDMSGGDEEQLGVTLDPRPDLNTEDRVAPTPTNPPSLARTPMDPPSLSRTPMDPPSLSRTPMDPPSLARTPMDPPSLARTPMDPPSLARTPMDPPSLARTPMDPPSLARTPMDPPSLARTPRDPLLPGGSVDLSLAPLLPGGSVDLSLAPLLPGGSVDLSLAPLLPGGSMDLSLAPLLLGGSVDLSLEANAIALRYLSDGQLSRLSAGVRGSRADRSVLLPSNMSLATRGYMRRYGLIEEEQEEEEEEEEEQCDGLPCATLGTGSSLPQSQLIRDLQPQLHLLARSSRTQDQDQGAVWQEASLAAGSVGNFLDVSRLRQLPKLF